MENLIFRKEKHFIFKDKVINSNKFNKWYKTLPPSLTIMSIEILDIRFNILEKIESLIMNVKYIDKNSDKEEIFIVGGGKMLLLTIITEEETDQKYVLLEKEQTSLLNKEILNCINIEIIGSEIKSKAFTDIKEQLPKILIEPKFNEIFHLTNGFLESSITDLNTTVFMYETVLKSNKIQSLLDTYNKNLNTNLRIIRLEEMKEKTNSLEAKLAFYSYQEKINSEMKDSLPSRIYSNSPKDLKMLETIKSAIIENRVISLYQPIIDNNKEQVVRYESLLRIINENEEMLTPDKFLNIAIKNNLYSSLTEIVIDQATKILDTNFFSIVINLNSTDLHSTKTKQKVFQLLEKNTNERNSKIIFELNEDQDYKDMNKVIGFIKKVKSYGAKIGIDDYGLSERGFNKMFDLKPDFIKIRKEMIKDIINNPKKQEDLKDLINFCKCYQMETVAPYIENEALFKLTKKIGVDFSQGYYFGKPEPLKLQ